MNATIWVDTLDFVGTKCDPAQPLKWPRSGAVCGDYAYGCADAPPQVEQATFIVANVLLGDPTFIIGNIQDLAVAAEALAASLSLASLTVTSKS